MARSARKLWTVNGRFATGRAVASAALIAAVFGVLASCSSPANRLSSTNTKGKEYFAESEYGVKASPRVSSKRTRLQRGGGRYQVGKPYQVKGKWYRPRENKNYNKVGKASWYGDAFHGRLTANGEVYDMTHLTAAHPTLPLPSYARVTNLKNGRSVIVRINDRGPFAHGRIIDLSKRAAQLLDYTKSGVAKVRVQYIGRAPLHGRDDRYLVASYRGPRGKQPATGGNIATGVMVAMNGSTPSAKRSAVAGALPKLFRRANAGGGSTTLPKYGPIVADRPSGVTLTSGVRTTRKSSRLLAYANDRVVEASKPFDKLLAGGLSDKAIRSYWKVRAGNR